MPLQKKVVRRINYTNIVPIKDTDIISMSLLATLNNVYQRHLIKI